MPARRWPVTNHPSAADRGAIFPLVMVILGFVVFVAMFIAVHAMWPDIETASLAGATNSHTPGVVSYYALFIFPGLPALFLFTTFVYFNVRANRDAGGP